MGATHRKTDSEYGDDKEDADTIQDGTDSGDILPFRTIEEEEFAKSEIQWAIGAGAFYYFNI